jgi:site-specific DNA-methyltransferase (adenine-specific)
MNKHTHKTEIYSNSAGNFARISNCTAMEMASKTTHKVDLLLCDPPYGNTVKAEWDKASSALALAQSIALDIEAWKPHLTPKASILVFCGQGTHGFNPMAHLRAELERSFRYRNTLTWHKCRGYGKSHDYMFAREEILWFSVSKERTEINFNIPYEWSENGRDLKRTANVFKIPEIWAPNYVCEKPNALLMRLIETHSQPGQLICDPYMGSGSTLVTATGLERNALGCDSSHEAYELTRKRLIVGSSVWEGLRKLKADTRMQALDEAVESKLKDRHNNSRIITPRLL